MSWNSCFPSFYADIFPHIYYRTLECFQWQIAKSMPAKHRKQKYRRCLESGLSKCARVSQENISSYSIFFMCCHTHVKATLPPSNSPFNALPLALISIRIHVIPKAWKMFPPPPPSDNIIFFSWYISQPLDVTVGLINHFSLSRSHLRAANLVKLRLNKYNFYNELYTWIKYRFQLKLATFLTFSSQHSYKHFPVVINIYVTVLSTSS